MDYLYLAVCVSCLSGGYIVSGLYGKRCARPDPFVNTVFKAATVALFFWAYNGFRFAFDKTTVLLSAGFALAYLISGACAILALKYGEVSLTSLLISYSLLLPACFGIFFLGDSVGYFFYAGLALLVISIFLINRGRRAPLPAERGMSVAAERGTPAKPARKAPVLWAVFAVSALVTNGACSILQSYQQRLSGGGFKAEFMIFAMLAVIAVDLAVILSARRTRLKEKAKYGAPFGIAAGILNAAVNLTVMLLVSAERLPVSIIFLLIAAGSLLVTYILSRIVFKEKLSFWQNAGFALGIFSVVFFNL
ncbi:MAG: hypothetical protein LBL66_03980 [Clostridiales bacterium]|jgi:drug/metabolite transporter (DMT)-like permease|nr:hypothetical protein [Clostridiales bacterium]